MFSGTQANTGNFPAKGGAAAKWRFLLKYAVLAPSTRNSQPWRWHINGDALELYADFGRAMPALDTRGREMIMSCGATLFTLRVAMDWFGCNSSISLYPRHGDDELLARLVFEDGLSAGDLASLFDGIELRHTQRLPFEDLSLPDALVEKLVEDALAENTRLQVVTSDDQRHKLAHLVAEGDRRQLASPTFRLGLKGLLRSNFTRRRDGMPGYAFGLGWLNSLLMPLAIDSKEHGTELAMDDCLAVAYAPLLVVLSTDRDDPPGWLAAGQALARVLLRAAVAGVQASFLNQPAQFADLRQTMRETLGIVSQHPHVMLRLGYATPTRATPRRPVAAVLDN